MSKKTMSKLVGLILAATMVLPLFAGCAGTQKPADTKPAETTPAETKPSESTTPAPEKKKVLGAVMIDMVNQFFVDMVEAGNVAAKDYNVDVIWKSADGSLDKQIALMENFIEQKVDCILVNPIDNDGLKPVIEKAAQAGIPTVTMAGIVNHPNNYNTLYNDYEDTKVIARILANLVGKKGKVALLYGNKGNVVSDLRQAGFMDGMKEFPEIQVIEQPANWDPATGLKVAQDIIAANKDLVGMHSVSDAVTLAAYQAVKAAKKEDQIIVTSYDGNKEACEAVKNGDFALTLLTGSKRVGYWNVKVGAALANGERPQVKDNTLYLSSYFIMNDDLKAKVKEWGLDTGISILTPDEGIRMADAYQEDLGPKK